MAEESMVHALEIIHHILVPDGRLVDIHPTGEPPSIEVVCGADRSLAGYLQEKDNFIEYEQAYAALTSAIAAGWFSVLRQGTFSFITRAETIAELHTFLDENWSDAILDPQVEERAAKLTEAMRVEYPTNSCHIEMSEHASITSLKRQPTGKQ